MTPIVMRDQLFDEEAILPLALIREHTKTDDVMSVTDPMLSLYRMAAIEAAEAYTGLLISGKRAVTEAVRQPTYGMSSVRRKFIHETEFMIAAPDVWFYGLEGQSPTKIAAIVGETSIQLPIVASGLDCCSPCGSGFSGGRVMYHAGFSCVDAIPAGFRLGALKYIAHVIENPGDTIGGYDQTAANPARASGAIDIWRVMLRSVM